MGEVEHVMRNGDRLEWPKAPLQTKTAKRMGAPQRAGDFLKEVRTEDEAEEREREYRRRRIKCAMSELYWNFAAWLAEGTEVRANHLQAAVKAHAALKGLGGDKIFKRKEVK